MEAYWFRLVRASDLPFILARILKLAGSLLATDRSKAVVLVQFLLNVFGVGVSCRNLYSFAVYLYVNGSGSITSVGEERAHLSAVVYL